VKRWQTRLLERLGVLQLDDDYEAALITRKSHLMKLAEDKRRDAEENAVMTERDIRRLTYQLFIAYPPHGLPSDEAGLEAVIVQLYRRASTYVNFFDKIDGH
jgi:hypothetical protein